VGHFTRVEVAKRLDALDVDAPTKNRYKLAASGFAKYLVRRGILETNFVRDIEGFGENDPRKVYYELRGEAADRRTRAAVGRCAAAMAYAFCMEEGRDRRGARARRRSHQGRGVLLRAWHQDGEPRAHVHLVEENRWLLPYIARRDRGQGAQCESVPGPQALDAPPRAAEGGARARDPRRSARRRFSQHTFHDWRHTRTVQLLRDGYEESVAAHDLGHEDVNLVRTTYGEFHRDGEPTTAASAPSRSSAPLPLPRPPSKLLH
jgi:integrase